MNGVPACSLSTPGPFAAGDKMTALEVSAQQSREEPHSAPSWPSPRTLTVVACEPLTLLGLVALGLCDLRTWEINHRKIRSSRSAWAT